MSLKDIVEVVSVVIAAITFVFSLLERNAREKRKEIADWQRLAVYESIRAGSTTFETIKLNYVVAAQQYPGIDIPKKDIQDGALRLALLSLIEAKLISLSVDGRYLLNVVSTDEEEYKKVLIKNLTYRENMAQMGNRVIDALRRESGRHTVEELFVLLKAEELGLNFVDVNALIQQMIPTRVFAIDQNQKLWLSTKLPQNVKPAMTPEHSAPPKPTSNPS